jgi:glucose/mannose-6-phosphate isomerase
MSRFWSAFSLKDETRYKIACGKMTLKTPKSMLDDVEEIKNVDKSNMLEFSIQAAKHYRQAARLAEKIAVNYAKPDNIIVAGMGGSAIGGELLKDYARCQTPVPIEVSKDYLLPAYASQRTLVVVVSYSGHTEESLSAFLDAQRRKCMIHCVSAGGCLLEFAEKLNVPHLRVPAGMPPRAASPYLFVPQLVLLEKMGWFQVYLKD